VIHNTSEHAVWAELRRLADGPASPTGRSPTADEERGVIRECERTPERGSASRAAMQLAARVGRRPRAARGEAGNDSSSDPYLNSPGYHQRRQRHRRSGRDRALRPLRDLRHAHSAHAHELRVGSPGQHQPDSAGNFYRSLLPISVALSLTLRRPSRRRSTCTENGTPKKELESNGMRRQTREIGP